MPKANVRWLTPEEGGRKMLPPDTAYRGMTPFVLGHPYEGINGWSIILTPLGPHVGGDPLWQREMVVQARLLVGDKGPPLIPGLSFDLHEGDRGAAMKNECPLCGGKFSIFDGVGEEHRILTEGTDEKREALLGTIS